MSTSDELQELLTLDEASKLLKCHKNSLRLWDKKGLLKAIRVGQRGLRYRKEDLITFLNNPKDTRVDSVSQNQFEHQLRIYETALANTSVFHYVFNLKGKFIYVNKPLLELWGKSMDEVYGKGFKELGYPDNLVTLHDQQLRQVITTKKPVKGENAYTNPEGKTGYYEYTFIPVFDNKGAVEAITGTTHDITDRKELEQRTLTREVSQSIRESEEKFQLIAKATNDAIWDWDLTTNTVTWNNAVTTLFGYKAEDIVEDAEWWYDHIHPDDRDRVVNGIHKVIDNGEESWSDEYKYQNADSTYTYVFDRGYIIHDDKGKPVRMIGSMLDLTERKKVEEALSKAKDESERQKRLYEAVTGSTPDLIYVFDLNYRFTYANPALLTMWGKTWNESIGKGLRDLGYEEWHATMHEREIDQILDSKQPVRGEVSFPHATLGKRTYDYILVPVLNEKGDVEAVAGTTRDVTDRKKVEETLRSTQLLYDKLFYSNIIGIFTPGFDGIIHDANDVFLNMIGYSKEDIKKKRVRWDAMTPPEYKEQDEQKLKELAETGEATPWEKEYIRKDGTRVPLLLGVVTTEKNANKGIAFAIDITERRKLERQKDEFIGIASHELKTPVTSIKAYAQLLYRKFKKSEDVSSSEMLAKMNTQLDKLTSLIRDLLDVTKIEGGKLKFNEGFFDFNELVEETVDEIQRTTENHKLIMKLAPTKSIFGDQERIGQVITNLLTNAIKYSPNASEIIITTKTDKENIILSVQDFGVGIAKNVQAKVFERFYRVGGESQETYSGLGLGLYISNEIIKRQNGKIWVESEINKGSTFYFSLPLKNSTKDV